jgi:ferredoxin
MTDDTLTQGDENNFVSSPNPQNGRYQVRVIPEKCIGAASCVAVAMKTFALNQKLIAYVLPTADEDNDDDKLLAAQSCPTGAIEIIDTVTGEKIWPR